MRNILNEQYYILFKEDVFSDSINTLLNDLSRNNSLCLVVLYLRKHKYAAF